MVPTAPQPFDNDSNKSLENEKSSYCLDFCLTTSTNGLPNLAKANNWFLRIFWFILIIGAIGATFYFIVVSFVIFFSFGVTTSFTSAYESPSDFPAITICNLVPFDTYVNLNYFQNILTANNLNYTIVPTTDNPGIDQVNVISEFLKAKIFSNQTANSTTLQSYGYSIDSLLISCYYNGLRCFSTEFNWFYDYNYGNCYTYNGNTSSVKKISKSGPKYGLQLELFTGIPGYQDYFAIQKGIYLGITNNSAIPLTNYEGIKLSVGQSTDVRISRTFTDRLSYPYSSCRSDVTTSLSSDNDLYKRTLKLNPYSLQLCYDLCLQRDFIVKSCGCSDPALKQFDTSVPICSSLTSLNCTKSVKDKFDSTPISAKCAQYCPTACSTVKYSTSSSSSGYPTDYYFKILSQTPVLQTKFKPYLDKNNQTLDKIEGLVQQSVVKVNVFYDDLSYTYISESAAVTVDSLFGTVGGELGLFLGMSLLTVFEFFELGYKFIEDIISRITKKK